MSDITRRFKTKQRIRNMTDITITVPIGFTVADIARANQSLSDSEWRELAHELHAIIAAVRASYIARPPSRTELVARLPNEDTNLPHADLLAFEEADLIESLRRTVVGIWPADDRETANLSVWLMERLTDLGNDSLYVRYLRLYDRIQSTDFAEVLTN
jgi:hypothetical protein